MAARVLLWKVPVKLVDARIDDNWNKFFSWVDEIRTLKVEANADTPKDIENAKKFGAEGVGLCRTEHSVYGSRQTSMGSKNDYCRYS